MKKIIGLLSLSVLFFTSCEQGLSEKEKQEFTQKGKEIAQTTFKKLGGELMAQMKEGGIAKATPYCNSQASGLTEKIAKKYDVTIKRTTDKLRNTANKPNAEEQVFLDRFKEMMTQGTKPVPVVEKNNVGEIHFYAPILVQNKCLVCHGVLGESLTHQADSIIKKLYPSDQAIGYKEGDLRGIWSIRFLNTEN
jgi:hypothetical protein